MSVWVVIGLHNGKLAYTKTLSNKAVADKLIEHFEKYDRENNVSSWDYVLQEETVWDKIV